MDEDTGVGGPAFDSLIKSFFYKHLKQGAKQVTKTAVNLDHMRPLNCFHLIPILLCGLIIAVEGQNPILAAKQGPPIRTGLWVMQPLPENDHPVERFRGRGTRESGTGRRMRLPSLECHRKESGKVDFGAIDKTVSVLRAWE